MIFFSSVSLGRQAKAALPALCVTLSELFFSFSFFRTKLSERMPFQIEATLSSSVALHVSKAESGEMAVILADA